MLDEDFKQEVEVGVELKLKPLGVEPLHFAGWEVGTWTLRTVYIYLLMRTGERGSEYRDCYRQLYRECYEDPLPHSPLGSSSEDFRSASSHLGLALAGFGYRV